MSFRCHWDDGGEDWLVCFPMPGKSMSPEDKVYREAVLMDYIARETTVLLANFII